jgi:hypothetical protein
MMAPSELTGEASMVFFSISSLLETGPLYRPEPTRRYNFCFTLPKVIGASHLSGVTWFMTVLVGFLVVVAL